MSRIGAAFVFSVICFTSGMIQTHARPQNGLVQADGFSFDGPVDRSDAFPQGRTTPRPMITRPTVVSLPVSTNTPTTQSLNMEQCIRDCPTTPEYNPVCGTDNVVYSNPGKLTCAINCGQNTGLRYYGPCSTTIRG